MLPRRKLGNTGLEVSVIGFGAFKIGRNQKTKYPQSYDLPDDREVERLLNGVLDLGISHIDTAPSYGVSEERIGRFLSARRSEFVLSTKVGETFIDGVSHYDFSRNAVRESLFESLRRLKTDCVDFLLIHATNDDADTLQNTPVVETLQELKTAGHTRAIGLSGKTVAAAEQALYWADALMVEYHQLDTCHADVIRRASELGIGVLVKKGLASGRANPTDAIPFVLNTPGVHNLVIGGLSLDHIRQNVAIANTLENADHSASPDISR